MLEGPTGGCLSTTPALLTDQVELAGSVCLKKLISKGFSLHVGSDGLTWDAPDQKVSILVCDRLQPSLTAAWVML